MGVRVSRTMQVSAALIPVQIKASTEDSFCTGDELNRCINVPIHRQPEVPRHWVYRARNFLRLLFETSTTHEQHGISSITTLLAPNLAPLKFNQYHRFACNEQLTAPP